jgi:uncharacterized membrane protein YbhN (UPF0104 family)
MKAWLRRWGWPIGKALLAAAILVGVGTQFYRDLHGLDWDTLSVQPEWLVLSGLLYLLALSFSSVYWYRLLRLFGEKPSGAATVKAYFLGHLGKYVPGKAWALLLRGTMVRGPEVRLGVAIVTAFYEVLTTMAAGALLAAIIFLVQPPTWSGLRLNPLYTGLLLVVVLAVPLWPRVFNFLVGRLAARFQKLEAFRQPRLTPRILGEGLAITGMGWIFLGASVGAMLWAVLPEPPAWTVQAQAHWMATIGLAYVAGFLAFVMPSGVGVREYFLLRLLGTEHTEALIALAVLLLRLVWTSAELVVAAVLWWIPTPQPAATDTHPDSYVLRI